MQLKFNTLSKQQVQNCWAFATDQKRARYKKLRSYRRCIITACSKEAKILGIKTGMKYNDAKLLIPDLKVMICNWR